MSSENSVQQELTLAAYGAMIETFNKRNHAPSEQMLRGLKEVLMVLTAMLSREANKKYYLSSLDPGVGKTTAISKWLAAYLQGKDQYGDEGVIVAVDTLSEVYDFVESCELKSSEFAVLVNHSTPEGRKMNGMGLGRNCLAEAPVLFTTKEQIRLRTERSDFEEVESLFYKGASRKVRIWDESLIVGKGLSVNRRVLLGTVQYIGEHDSELADNIENLCIDIQDKTDGETYEVPVFTESINTLLYYLKDAENDKKDAIEAFWSMSGRIVTVRVDNSSHTLIDVAKGLPDDFAPCLVTDASGRIRETYNLQQQDRDDLVRLYPEMSSKTYDNLSIRVWRRASGKSFYRKNGTMRTAEEIVEVVRSRPDEPFLVVGHKGVEMERDVMPRLDPDDRCRVHFLTYGKHLATNKYADIPNVIVSSLLYYRVAQSEVIARAASTKSSEYKSFSRTDLEVFRRAEAAHHLFQAVCRGAVRKAQGHCCPESRLWLISDPKTKIEPLLPKLFVNCRVSPWKVKNIHLKSVCQEAYDYIGQRIDAGERVFPASDLKKHLGFTDSSNFRRQVTSDQALLSKLAEMSVTIETRGGSRRPYFVLQDYEYFFGESVAA